MSTRSEDLVDRFTAFNNELIGFVENCSDENWQAICSGETWPVSVVAHHIAAGHYGILELAKMIIDGKKLPEFTSEAIDQMNAEHAQKHADCTKDEVIGILRANGQAIADFLISLDDADLDRTGFLSLAGGDISTQQLAEMSLLESSAEHLSNMKSAIET